MAIDTKELRRLAQAATPGPWVSQGRYIGTPRHMSYVGEVRDQCGNWSDTEKSRADAAFIAAANPAAITEILDRLEAAENEVESLRRGIAFRDDVVAGLAVEHDTLRAENAGLVDDMNLLRDNNTALRARIEALENERTVDEQRIADLMAELNRVGHENEELHTKIADMERQEPVAEIVSFGGPDLKEVAWKKGKMPTLGSKLYALPGAKGE